MTSHTEALNQENTNFEEILNYHINQINSYTLPDQLINVFQIICGPELLLAALELLDLKAVKKLVLKTAPTLYEVQGNEAVYHVQCGFRCSCNCKTYIDRVIMEACQPICAHLLAVRIGDKMDLIETQEITLETFIGIFCP